MWEERFATPDYVFGTAPAAFLRKYADLLTPMARVLSIAEGEGRNAVWLAEQGLRVTELEFAPSAIAKAHALATARGVSLDMQAVDVLAQDWTIGRADGFDVVLGVFIQFAGPEGRARLFYAMALCTRPGGLVMLHGYTPAQLAHGTGGPRAVENLYTPELLRAAFAGWQVEVCAAYEATLDEGRGHRGLSALIDFIVRRPEV